MWSDARTGLKICETIENYCSGALKNKRKAGSLQTKCKEITASIFIAELGQQEINQKKDNESVLDAQQRKKSLIQKLFEKS